MTARWGAAVVHEDIAYFSESSRVYSYTLAKDEWTKLRQCEYGYFGLAVVNNKVTTIGGSRRDGTATSSLLCLEDQGTKWRELLPPMPTARFRPATVTIPTNLIVAGGRAGAGSSVLCTIEILDTNTLQWSSATSSPKALEYPHISLCGEHLYLSEDDTIFSCSVEKLLKSCKPASTYNNAGDSVWTKRADISVPYGASLTTLRGQVVAIGGSNQPLHGTPTGTIHCYDRTINSWSVIGEIPTARPLPLVAVLPNNKLIAVGGVDKIGRTYRNTEITSTD